MMLTHRKGLSYLILLATLIYVLGGCAPKRVHVYGVPDKVRSEIVLFALSLQGKPYRNGARGPDAFDCSGFVYHVFKRSQILLPPPAETQARSGYEVARGAAQPGDIVFFKIRGSFHAGILINDMEFVHASQSKGVSIGNLNSDYWRRNFYAFRSVL
jgi:cell wall-associated NlpC family hydrolase